LKEFIRFKIMKIGKVPPKQGVKTIIFQGVSESVKMQGDEIEDERSVPEAMH